MVNNSSRLKKTKLNVISNVFIMLSRIVMLFVVRIIFIRTIGEFYLGVDSLFTNLLSVLSIGELGVTSAVNFVLYKPLVENDVEKISSIMTYYKKMFRYMGLFLLGVGLVITLFLPLFVKEEIPNLYLVYFMYLFNTVSTYFVSYKESLIIADQNRYRLTVINFVFYMLLYVLRILALLYTKNFILYVLILDVVTLLQRIMINMYVTKTYKFIDFNSKNELSEDEKNNIFTRIKAMFIHKIGAFVINGTDSMVISATSGLGVVVVGIYTNYLSIITTATSLYEQVYKGITSSFGDLAAQEDEEAQKRVFNIIGFVCYLMYGVTSVGFYFLLSPLIEACFGSKLVIEKSIVVIMIINFYFSGLIASIDLIKEATGEFLVDKYMPLIQSLVNIVVSLILANIIGLMGVVLGTAISYLTVSIWSRPYIAFKYIFKSSMIPYYVRQLKYISSIVLSIVLINLILKYVSAGSGLMFFFVTGCLCVFIFVIVTIALFYKSNEFIFFKNELLKTIRKK